MSIYLHNSAKIRMSEGAGGDDWGISSRRQSWVNSSSLAICRWNLGAHQCASFEMHYSWTDWCCNSGGGGIVRGVCATGYGQPGLLQDEAGHYDSHSFALSKSGNTVTLSCSGGNGNGPGNVYIGVRCNRIEAFVWAV